MVVILCRLYILKLKIIQKFHNFVDLVVIVCFLADIFYSLTCKKSIIYVETGFSSVIRSIKIIRLIKILYIKDSMFKY